MGAIGLGTGLVPILNNITTIARTVDSAFSTVQGLSANAGSGAEDIRRQQIRAEQDLALKQLKQRQNLDETQAVQDVTLERQRIALQARQDEDTRRAALRRAVARQRANFGAQGVGSGAGSSEAVLLGLFEETEGDLERRNQIDTLRSSALNQGLDQQRSLNLLQATQLTQRQNLSRLF